MIGADITRITGVRLAGTGEFDVRIANGTVVGIRPADPEITTSATADHLHLPGWYLLSSAVEPHAHVDKAFSWPTDRPSYGDLPAAIARWREIAAGLTEDDIYRNARRAFAEYLSHGITAVRTHVDLLGDADPLRAVRAVLRLRTELREIMDIQVALLAPGDGPIEDALRLGVDVLGGCPHLRPDPAAEVTRLLDLAADFGVAVDLHTDEQLGADVLSIEPYAAELERRGITGAAASHCVSLGALDPETLAAVIDKLKRAGLGIISLPITNLYLQGRGVQSRTPRGITPLRALTAAGVPVAAGGDNVRDPFNPMGRADPFETTSLLVTASHLDIEQALNAVTAGARQILGLGPAGPVVGQRADLLAVQANSLADVAAGPGDARIVLFRGRLVSRTHVTGEHAIDPGTRN